MDIVRTFCIGWLVRVGVQTAVLLLLTGCAKNPAVHMGMAPVDRGPANAKFAAYEAPDTDDATERARESEAEPGAATPPATATLDGETYSGKARKAAKLAIVDAPVETFDSVTALRESLWPAPQNLVQML